MKLTYQANVTKALRGFTLVELVIVIVIVSILSIYAMTQHPDSAEMTLPSQAERLASDIRLAQTLAFTSGKGIRLTVDTPGANGVYSVACIPTCDTSNNFTVTMQKGISLTGTTPVEFNTLGVPNQTATYTLAAGSSTKTVTIAALTGHVSVTP